MRKVAPIISLALLVGLAGCTTKKTEAPPLTGPSGFALQLSLQSVPDSILQDGASQASINIEATGPDGRGLRALPLRLDMAVVTDAGETFADFGTLSAKTVMTGEDGRARVVYTAPPRPPESVGLGTIVKFYVTPIGSDYQGEQPRNVSLRLVPPGVILPPNDAPVAAFTFSPTTVGVLQDIVFDASTTTDGTNSDGSARTCGASCSYSWDFGDGASASGIFVTHRFQRTGLYVVKLTVTDGGRASATVSQAVSVGQGQAPTALFTYSPSSPAVSQDIFFNATGSTAATNRRIVAWDWDFGSGRQASGVTVTKRYDTAGTYVVTLIVTDDAGTQARTTQNVTVGGTGTGAVAQLVVSPPTAGSIDTTFNFDARGSTSPSPIVEYRFSFGDGTADQVGTSPSATHQFATAGTYVVRLTIRDSLNRTATTTLSVTVAAGGPVASLTVSPTAGTVATNFFFDGRPSTGGSSTIVEYRFTFGDGSADVTNATGTTTHSYAVIGTYIARLTVTDAAGRTATITQTITVSP
jgi:PKD repeat protein